MINEYLNKKTKTAPLAVFRFFFGLLMFISTIRFWSYGWIDSVYIQPKFHFTYYGFNFIKPLGEWTYVLFLICAISSLVICVGYKYRIAIIVFFLSFTYIELIDKTPYLNHYYFVSLVSFLLVFLPANASFSVDAYLNPKKYFTHIPKWTIDSIKLMLFLVYFYAGLAKINSDWLIEALPLKIWLQNKYDAPIIGSYLKYNWVHYFFSWFGMFYDIFIVFFLLYKPTRVLAYIAVVIFHLLTHLLFPIGMFPYVMIVSGLIFFNANLHEKIIERLTKVFKQKRVSDAIRREFKFSKFNSYFVGSIVVTFFIIQLLLPWRYLFYPGELFWTEEGYRFSWRVMLVEKVGYTVFTIVNPKTGGKFEIRNDDFLTSFQIKQMSTQPDFILQYAHMLRDHYINEGIENPEVYAKSYVTLNGRLSQPFIDSEVNLANEKESFAYKKWVLPFKDEIKGL